MILGSITYRGESILDFSPYWIIGTQKAYVTFHNLDDALQFIDEFKQSIGAI